jgi:hypothetical protein
LDNIDMAAVARVSGRVSLQSIRLTELTLNAPKLALPGSPLEPEFSRECVAIPSEKGSIAVSCSYKFKVRSVGEEIADINARYDLYYRLSGEEPPSEEDVKHFAAANGAYHSWPFLRELIFGLTARIGYQPFTLPVLSFLPKSAPAASPAVTPTTPGAV